MYLWLRVDRLRNLSGKLAAFGPMCHMDPHGPIGPFWAQGPYVSYWSPWAFDAEATDLTCQKFGPWPKLTPQVEGG
jgi:hypothetical protein